MRNKYETGNINLKIKDMMSCQTEEEFAHWLLVEARKYGISGRKYR